MTMKKLITLALAFVLALAAARACDVQVTHFEDGSGRVTYCLPFTLCQE
jgi:hypothetical protein